MARQLNVYYNSAIVGLLKAERDQFSFSYDPAWLQSGFPLSYGLPLRAETYGDEATRAYFENLLPEDSVLAVICKARKISRHDLISFFEIHGQECAGAIALACEAVAAEPETPLRDVTSEIRRYLGKKLGGSLLAATRARLSLAGAQDKLPAIVANGRIFLASGQQPSTHIIKPDIAGFPWSARNEHFCMQLARGIGCNLANTELICFPEGDLFVTERFDRARQDNAVIRLHQQDFCQALGLSGAYKYQRSGGYDGIASMTGLCRAVGIACGDYFGRALILNYLTGNCDGHAKNFSILHQPRGATLAPLYDILSTAVYPGLDRDLGMAFGNSWSLEQINAADLPVAATDCGMEAADFIALAHEMTCQCGQLLPELLAEHRASYGPCPVYDELEQVISENCRRLAALLAGSGEGQQAQILNTSEEQPCPES